MQIIFYCLILKVLVHYWKGHRRTELSRYRTTLLNATHTEATP